MTVAIALQVHDGVVLASDSASTLVDTTKVGPESVLNVYNNANKIFNIVKGLPIGGVTYGMGSIGSSSISTLIKDLRRFLSGEDKSKIGWRINELNYTIEEVAIRIRKFLFEDIYMPLSIATPGVQFGFIVAGYSAGAQLSEVWSIEIANGQCPPPNLVIGQGVASCVVGGDPDAFNRLANGYSTTLPALLNAAGLDPASMAKVISVLPALAVSLIEAPMPIQDAIDLAEFFVSTTANFAKFKRGAATVGGPVESAAITKHEHFKWVHRKHYFSDDINPRGNL